MLDPKCIFRKSIFAKCTRLACLLSFASLFFIVLLIKFWPEFVLKYSPAAERESIWNSSTLRTFDRNKIKFVYFVAPFKLNHSVANIFVKT